MKRLIFMRHGKAEDPIPDISDFERSLTLKGKIVTRQITQILKEKIKNPGILISSPAFRAIETAIIFAGEYAIKPDQVKLAYNIYYKFDEKTLMELLKGVDETADTVTFFGHNPAFTNLVGYFGKESVDIVPKSGVVSLKFNVALWSDIKPGTGEKEFFLKPKSLL